LSSEEEVASCEFVHSISSNLENYPKHFSRADLLTSAPLTSLPPCQYEALPRGFVTSSTLRLTVSMMMSKILTNPIKERFILGEIREVVSKGKVSLEKRDLA